MNLRLLLLFGLLLTPAADATAGSLQSAEAKNTAPNDTAVPAGTERTQQALMAFYTAYCALVAGDDDPAAERQLLDRHLTPDARRKMERAIDKSGANPLLRAQDLGPEAAATLAVAHVEGAWYAVAHFDRYAGRCTIVPVEATLTGDTLQIRDFALP